MVMEVMRYLAAGGFGLILGRSLRPAARPAASVEKRDWGSEEATISASPLQVIGGSRRGPGSGDGA